MWILQLNDMRAKDVLSLTSVARAETKEELEAFVKQETVDPYQTTGYGDFTKCFKEGGPLEWFNPAIKGHDVQSYINAGDAETWAERARIDFNDRVMSIPGIPK